MIMIISNSKIILNDSAKESLGRKNDALRLKIFRFQKLFLTTEKYSLRQKKQCSAKK
jgi:hypothetical protein